MGKAVCALFAARGFRVFALDKEPADEGEGIIPIQADVTSQESLSAAFSTVSAQTDGLAAVIHLAGIYMLDSLAEISPESFERIFRVNLYGAFLVNRTFLPLLGSGARVIMVTSELAVRGPLPFTGLYAVTKTALDRYAYSLRMELQLLGVQVSVLRAGAVDTGMISESTAALSRFCSETKLYSCNARRFKAIVDRVEARRIPPEKVAARLLRIAAARRPRFAYSINRNKLLILFDMLPMRLRFFIIRRVLK